MTQSRRFESAATVCNADVPCGEREVAPRWRTIAAWTLAFLLAAASATNAAKGLRTAWTPTADGDRPWPARVGDYDMRDRAAEYRCFRRGVYPNRQLGGQRPPSWQRTSPYPPYAIPMFALFFEPGGVFQGRIVLECLSLGSLVVMGIHGFRELRFAGPAMGAIGALAGAAIMGNSTVIELGHFSIICTGLIVGQMILLQRGRPVLAGLCWSLAMIKPQIAIAFAALFLVDRRWRGLATGSLVLAGCGLFSCWWTGVSPLQAVSLWMRGVQQAGMLWKQGQGIGPASVAAAIDVHPMYVHVFMFVLCGCGIAMVWWACAHQPAGSWAARSRIGPMAGICAVFGELCFYHYHYDNVMLFPAAIAILKLAATVPTWWSTTLASLMMATLWIPHRWMTQVPCNGMLRSAVWLAVAAVLSVFVFDGAIARLLRRTRSVARV